MRGIIDYIRKKGLDREGIRYIIVGGLTTLINFGLFVLICKIIGIDVTLRNVPSIQDSILSAGETSISAPILFANVTSISASIIFAYFANKLFVFKWRCNTRAELALEFIKFIGSRLVTMVIEIGAVWLFIEALSWNIMLGKGVAQVIVIILNYLISKLLVFRRAKES